MPRAVDLKRSAAAKKAAYTRGRRRAAMLARMIRAVVEGRFIGEHPWKDMSAEQRLELLRAFENISQVNPNHSGAEWR